MDELDKKLGGVVVDAIKYGDLRRKWGNDPRYVPDPIETELRLIKEIKQAFIDTGWKHDGFTDAVQHVYKKRAEGVEPTLVRIADTEFMTGQEWYDRFEKELKFDKKHILNQCCDCGAPYNWEEAAKKAAGIK